MMAMGITLRVISPKSTVFDSVVEEVVLPSTQGPLSLKPGDSKTVPPLATGVIRFRRIGDQRWECIAVMGGFAELEDDDLNVLVNDAELGDQINVEVARAALVEAEQAMKRVPAGDRQAAFAAEQARARARAVFEAASGSV
jgi:F-type H+-transporting ATPase subunit epsilon